MAVGVRGGVGDVGLEQLMKATTPSRRAAKVL
jgi:hypothetical protein